MSFDVIVNGEMGLYMIDPLTPRARSWLKKNIRGEQTHVGRLLACEGSRNVREIVAGMVRDELAVEVNGVDMKGFGG